MTHWPDWMKATPEEIREAHANNGHGFCTSGAGTLWYPTHAEDVIDMYLKDGRLIKEVDS